MIYNNAFQPQHWWTYKILILQNMLQFPNDDNQEETFLMSSLFHNFSLLGTIAASTEILGTGHVRTERHVEQTPALIQNVSRFADSYNQSATRKASWHCFVLTKILDGLIYSVHKYLTTVFAYATQMHHYLN